MPNWCINSAYFTHENPETVTALENVFRDFEKAGDNGTKIGPFQYLHPMPETASTENTENDDSDEQVKPPNKMPDWWTWRIENWGTKWEPSSIELERMDENTLFVRFDSAWTPPIPLYNAALKLGWKIEASYHESGMGFEGEYENGIDKCWDIEEDIEQ